MTKKKVTVVSEAQELLDKTLHDIKVKETARLLVELNNLEEDYKKKKAELEKKIEDVDTIRIINNNSSFAEVRFYSSNCTIH